MKNFQKDQNGIYVNDSNVNVFYHDKFNDICFGVEDSNFWFNNRNEIIGSLMQNFSPNCTFADVGGGNGFQTQYLSRKFPDSKFFLIEPGYDGCRNAQTRGGGVENIYNCTAEHFDFREANVTAIGLFDVIEHIEEDVPFLQRLVDKTSDDTLFYITTPSYDYLWNDMDILGGHFRRYNRKLLMKMGLDAGLEPLFFSYFFSYLTVPYLLFRVLPFRFGKKTSEEDVIKSELNAHKYSRLMSRIFAPFHYMEKNMIKRNGGIPFGTSSVIIFKKK